MREIDKKDMRRYRECVKETASETRIAELDVLMTAEEVAELVQMRTDWVYAEARAGRIPFVPMGRYRRFRRSTIQKWISQREIGTI